MSLFDTTSWRRRWDPNAHNLLPASDSRNGAARGAGFLSVETHGILPTKRAVSGSSSDTTDEIASDHASSTSDVKVNNTTRSPTMASSSPRAGSSTPADNHTSDSNSAQETSSASLLTSSTQGRHGTTTASSTVTTEGQQPTGASSAISSLSSRITDTASTAAITEGQQHTSFTSATSKGELFYSKDLGGTSTELTTSSS
ncbi:hypothetical protein J3R30DRAFT_2755126 [Lentinula aciculospora]|uniref:Uncharacterized protein n=1 Tax=Lentinula aciculospora TaxID=153920 RepID=A0A9W9ADD2_9AGAR|nr:hypothetical protein J3R30DRAFT_2755126 [Lentinula aciculospora]